MNYLILLNIMNKLYLMMFFKNISTLIRPLNRK